GSIGGINLGVPRRRVRALLASGDLAGHQAADFVLLANATKAIDGADFSECFVKVGARRRARGKVIFAPPDRFAPKMQERRSGESLLDPRPIARQERLPELLGLDRVADVRIERPVVNSMLFEDWRQQERAERAPFLVDVDHALGC